MTSVLKLIANSPKRSSRSSRSHLSIKIQKTITQVTFKLFNSVFNSVNFLNFQTRKSFFTAMFTFVTQLRKTVHALLMVPDEGRGFLILIQSLCFERFSLSNLRLKTWFVVGESCCNSSSRSDRYKLCHYNSKSNYDSS